MSTPRAHRGFTLAEAVMSAAIIGMISLGMVGALVVVAKAAPASDTATRSRTLAANVMAELCTELRYAAAVRSIAPAAIEFTVPDRDGDGDEEVIAYEWHGAGTPLERVYNGERAPVIPSLTTFSLEGVRSRTTVTTNVAGTSSSGEVRLAKFDGWLLVLTPTATQTSLTGTLWASSYFKIDQVTLPANMTKLDLTRLKVKLKKSATPTGTTVSAGFYTPLTATKPQPSTTQLGSTATLPVSSLPTSFGSFCEFAFTDVSFTSAPAELVFVLKGTGTAAAAVQYYNSILATADTTVMLTSSDSGSSWLPTKNQQQNDILFEVWGSYEWPSTTTVSTDYYNLQSVTVSMATGAATADRASTTVRTLNKPAVPGP